MEATARKADPGRSRACPQDTDRYIGARIRERRIMLGLAQLELAAMIGVTFQQMHKYENGINRISAGRLYPLAQALGVEVSYFYPEMTAAGAVVGPQAHERLLLALARNFIGISKLEYQEALCALTLALKDQDAGLAPTADPGAS